MPTDAEDRITVTLGADLIRSLRACAETEKRTMSAVVADALTAYLGRAPGAVVGDADVRALVTALQQMLPRMTKVAEDHDEVMDTLDEITSELGRREGAALALERIAAHGAQQR